MFLYFVTDCLGDETALNSYNPKFESCCCEVQVGQHENGTRQILTSSDLFVIDPKRKFC